MAPSATSQKVNELKKLVRAVPGVERANAVVKRAWQGLAYRTSAFVNARRAAKNGIVYNELEVPRLVRERLAARGLVIRPKPKGALSILWLGSLEMQDRSGTIQGLEKWGQVVCFSNRHGYGGGGAIPEENGKRLLEIAHDMGRVDLVIGNTYGASFRPDDIAQVGRMGAVMTNISMDDRHYYRGPRLTDGRRAGPAGLNPGLDFACTTTRDTCINYLLDGVPALWLPMASDPDIFRPFPDVKKDVEVSFVGMRYGMREALVEFLRSHGVDVQVWGLKWPRGALPIAEVPQVIARSKVCLGVSSIGFTWGVTGPKMRDYDVTMAGGCYVTQHSAELCEHFVPGREIDTYTSFEECLRKVRLYVNRPDLAAEMGRAARARCMRDHTWEGRFEKMLRIVGLMENG